MNNKSRNLILAAEISGLLHQLGKLHPKWAPLAKPPQHNPGWLLRFKQHKEWAEVLTWPEALNILAQGLWVLEEGRNDSELQTIENILLSPSVLTHIHKTRQKIWPVIQTLFRKIVTAVYPLTMTTELILWPQYVVTASLFKIAVAEGILRSPGHLPLLANLDAKTIPFRLLGIRWNWAELVPGVLQPVVFTALAVHRDEAVAQLRQLLEVDHPIGNLIYDDDEGVVLIVPSFTEGCNSTQSETRFRQTLLDPLLPSILNALVSLGAGTPVRIAWTLPQTSALVTKTSLKPPLTLPLLEYSTVLTVHPHYGPRELLLQVGEVELHKLWTKPTARPVEICPQCGLRPSLAREWTCYDSTSNPTQTLCDYCASLVDEEYYQKCWQRLFADQRFGFMPQTLNLQAFCQHRPSLSQRACLTLLSIRTDLLTFPWSVRSFSSDLLREISLLTGSYLLPISLDAQGCRIIVATHDTRQVLFSLHDQITRRFNPGHPVRFHLSVVICQASLPLFVAFEALQRLEQRLTLLPLQQWRLTKQELLKKNQIRLTWQTPRGSVVWTIDLSPQADSDYFYVLCLPRTNEPGHLVAVTDLTVGDVISLKPATFDFAVLDSSTSHYPLIYHPTLAGARYHPRLGRSGRPPYLLEQLPDLLELVPNLFTKQLKWNQARRQAIYGQVAEHYEKWVREVPTTLQPQGRAAWHLQMRAMFAHYLPKEVKPRQQEILTMLDDMLEDGRFFDAFDLENIDHRL